jgi:hypothetical protein
MRKVHRRIEDVVEVVTGGYKTAVPKTGAASPEVKAKAGALRCVQRRRARHNLSGGNDVGTTAEGPLCGTETKAKA